MSDIFYKAIVQPFQGWIVRTILSVGWHPRLLASLIFDSNLALSEQRKKHVISYQIPSTFRHGVAHSESKISGANNPYIS